MERKDLTFDDVVSAYLGNCSANEVVASTIEYYRNTLASYKRSLEKSCPAPIWPTVESVAVWKQELSDKGLKITTVDLYMRVLSSFMRWAVDMGMMESNCCIPAVMPKHKIVRKVSQRPYNALLDDSAITRVFAHKRPQHVSETIWRRNRAIIVLFLATGIRNTELRMLSLSDLDFKSEKILIRNGKGGKVRFVSFPQIARIAVQEYLSSGYRPCSIPADAPLFGVNGSKHKEGWHELDRCTLSQMVERNVKAILGQSGVRTHALRHSCASVMWDSGASLDDISNILGHSSVTTTERYAERLRPSAPIERANAVFDNMLIGI